MDFCILISYTANSPSSFIHANSFLVISYIQENFFNGSFPEFLMCKIFVSAQSCHLHMGSVLLLPFQCCPLLFYISCPISLAGTSSAMLKRRGETEPPSLVTHLRWKRFSLSLLSRTLLVTFCLLVCVWGGSFFLFFLLFLFLFWFVFFFRYSYQLELFLVIKIYQKGVLKSVRCFSLSLQLIICFFCIVLFMWCLLILDFQILNQPCVPGI